MCPVGTREQKSKETHERKVKVLHLMLVGIVDELNKLSHAEKNVISRMISNSIFDMRVIWSGKYSQALVDALITNSKTQKCAEHYYPRQVAGQRILQHMERYRGISLKKLKEFLDVFTQVHYTTSQENQLLKPYQKVDTFISPEHSYQMAGITLTTMN